MCLFCVLECPDHFWFWSTKNGGQNVKWRPSSQWEDKFGQFGRTRRTKCQKGGRPPNGRTCGISVLLTISTVYSSMNTPAAMDCLGRTPHPFLSIMKRSRPGAYVRRWITWLEQRAPLIQRSGLHSVWVNLLR